MKNNKETSISLVIEINKKKKNAINLSKSYKIGYLFHYSELALKFDSTTKVQSKYNH